MGATNKTPNLDLPQFVGTDKPSWLGDFNGAMNSIDTFAGKTTGDIGTVTATANAAKSAADAASASVAALETTVTQHTSEISDAMADVSALEADVTRINNKLSDLNAASLTLIEFELYSDGSWNTAKGSILKIGNNVAVSFPVTTISIQTSGAFLASIRTTGNIFNLPFSSAVTPGIASSIAVVWANYFAFTVNLNLMLPVCAIFYNSTDNKTYFSFDSVAGGFSSVQTVGELRTVKTNNTINHNVLIPTKITSGESIT